MPRADVDIQRLSKSYRSRAGTVSVFEDLTVNFEGGEITCLVGPSGCGKSTLLMCIAGLESYDGAIFVADDLVDSPGSDRSLVFQAYAMVPWRTVLRNVTLGLELKANRQPRRQREETAMKLIELTGLNGFEDAYPDTLSGGMKQRVAIARALATEPRLLLMDEPFGALDALTRRRMGRELIRIWSQAKPTIVFVTHSVDEALAIGDRIVVCSERPMRILKDLRLANPREGGSPEELASMGNDILGALGFDAAVPSQDGP